MGFRDHPQLISLPGSLQHAYGNRLLSHRLHHRLDYHLFCPESLAKLTDSTNLGMFSLELIHGEYSSYNTFQESHES